jgi:hypothetical protein
MSDCQRCIHGQIQQKFHRNQHQDQVACVVAAVELDMQYLDFDIDMIIVDVYKMRK